MIFENNCHLARHVETSKNELGLHGKSNEAKPTKWTEYQIQYLVNYCKKFEIQKIFYASTIQCLYTSNRLSKLLGIDIFKLGLEPINLGKFSGLSHMKLIESNISIARAMEIFRFRISSFKDTDLVDISSPQVERQIITNWLANQKKEKFNDSLIVLSSSLLVKLGNLRYNILPDLKSYKNIGVSNAGIIDFTKWSPKKNQWPLVIHKNISTKNGNIVLAEYYPTISPYNTMVVIIYPGIFGSSRFGPYNLFNRLARELADKGIRSVIFDSIGSGEALPCYRSMETELFSLNKVVSYYQKRGSITICAHSLSANIVNRYLNVFNIKKILIAPLLDIILRKEACDINDGHIFRHGLFFSDDFLKSEELQDFSNSINTEFIFGTSDHYVNYRQFALKDVISKFHLINDAGHNFSEGNSSNQLIDLITTIIKNNFWGIKNIS